MSFLRDKDLPASLPYQLQHKEKKLNASLMKGKENRPQNKSINKSPLIELIFFFSLLERLGILRVIYSTLLFESKKKKIFFNLES